MNNRKNKMIIELELTEDVSIKIALEARIRNVLINDILVESLEKRYNNNEPVEGIYHDLREIFYQYMSDDNSSSFYIFSDDNK
jgi:hypothetical protein